jgi:DNA primase
VSSQGKLRLFTGDRTPCVENDRTEALAALAQVAALELHIASKIARNPRPARFRSRSRTGRRVFSGRCSRKGNARKTRFTVCVRMASDNPKQYLVNMSKKLRGGRNFLDYLRNDRMATAVAPLRRAPVRGACVSMPLT